MDMAGNFSVCLNAVLPIFLEIAAGYAAKCAGLLGPNEVGRFNKVIYSAFLPVLMFYNIYRSELASAVRPRLILFVVLSVLVLFALSVLFARRFARDPGQKSAIAQGLYRSNFVIVGLPVAANLMPDADIGPIAVLVSIVVPMYNILAVILLESYSGGKVSAKKLLIEILKNPLVQGTVVGFLALAVGLRLPKGVETAVSQMAQAVSPVQLFLLGAFFRFGGLKERRRELTAVCLGRLVVIPAIFLSLGALLGFRGLEFAGLIGIFCSSNATTSFSMVQEIGGDAELAGDIVVLTSALCSFTMFLWCLLFSSLGFFA